MTTAVLFAADTASEALMGPDDRAPSLDRLIAAAWAGLAVQETVDCPVCGGPMAPEYGAGARPIAGRCSRCASSLS
jgi:hypothetical protein